MVKRQERKQRALTSERVNQDSPAFLVVDKFGGLTRFCELTDFPAGTVHGWLVNGLIPSRKREHSELGEISYQKWILLVAEMHRIPVSPKDFIEREAA